MRDAAADGDDDGEGDGGRATRGAADDAMGARLLVLVLPPLLLPSAVAAPIRVARQLR